MTSFFESPGERRQRRREEGEARLQSYFVHLDAVRASTARRRGFIRGLGLLVSLTVAMLYIASFFRGLLP